MCIPTFSAMWCSSLIEVSSVSTMAGRLAGVITGGFAPLPCTNSKMRPTTGTARSHPQHGQIQCARLVQGPDCPFKRVQPALSDVLNTYRWPTLSCAGPAPSGPAWPAETRQAQYGTHCVRNRDVEPIP
jgi:hypothetical protein